MEKEPCTNLCGILISSHEVMKLDTFEIDESDGLPAKVHNISPLIFSHAFVNFTKKVPSTECYYGFDHFWQAYKLTKF